METIFGRSCRAGVGPYPHHLQLLSSRFRYSHRRVFWGRARLYGDRIELTGWHLRGRHRRCIPLARIADVEYYDLDETANVTLFLDDDSVVSFHVREDNRWRALLESWLRYDAPRSLRRFDGVEEAEALAA